MTALNRGRDTKKIDNTTANRKHTITNIASISRKLPTAICDYNSNTYNISDRIFIIYGVSVHLYGDMVKHYGDPVNLYGDAVKHYGVMVKHYGDPVNLYDYTVNPYGNSVKSYGFPVKLYGIIGHIENTYRDR